MSKAKKPSKTKAEDIPLFVLTNERTQFKANQIMMFYKASSLGQLAYMDGMDPETGEIVPLLVGLEPTENDTQFKVYPLAKLISNLQEIKNYLVPDGSGNYIDYSKQSSEKEGPAEEIGTGLVSLGEALGGSTD